MSTRSSWFSLATVSVSVTRPGSVKFDLAWGVPHHQPLWHPNWHYSHAVSLFQGWLDTSSVHGTVGEPREVGAGHHGTGARVAQQEPNRYGVSGDMKV